MRLWSLLALASAHSMDVPLDSAQTRVVKFKLVAGTRPEDCADAASSAAAAAGLANTRRTFRSAGKHEAKHIQAGLHRWCAPV